MSLLLSKAIIQRDPRHAMGMLVLIAGVGLLLTTANVAAQTTEMTGDVGLAPTWLDDQPSMVARFLDPASMPGTIKTVAALSILSLAPAILLMTTSFIRVSIVLGLLRQAMGTQMLPSNQIMTSLAMFLTVLIMAPVWMRVYEEAIVPYSDTTSGMTAETAWRIGINPVREFMGQQIERAGNTDDVWLFYDYLPTAQTEPQSYQEVPLPALLPAFVLSELKVAFLIGFQVFLPFLIIDLVVASVTSSLGIMMMPPTMISLPLKLVMFVMVDGWHLVVGMLLESFGGGFRAN